MSILSQAREVYQKKIEPIMRTPLPKNKAVNTAVSLLKTAEKPAKKITSFGEDVFGRYVDVTSSALRGAAEEMLKKPTGALDVATIPFKPAIGTAKGVYKRVVKGEKEYYAGAGLEKQLGKYGVSPNTAAVAGLALELLIPGPGGEKKSAEKIVSLADVKKVDKGIGKVKKPLKQSTDNIFKNETELGVYDPLIQGKTYHGRVGEVIEMTPDEYLSKIPKSEPTESSLKYMRDKIARGEKLPMASLDYSRGGFTQEGRNRAYLAKEMGIEKMPVLVVNDEGIKISTDNIQPLSHVLPKEEVNLYGIDALTSKKITSLVKKDIDNPVKEGFQRFYQATGKGLSSNQYFDNPDSLARFMNNGTSSGSEFKYVDVPVGTFTKEPIKPNIWIDNSDPIKRVVDALGQSKSLQVEQKGLRSAERYKRFKTFERVGQNVSGEIGARKQLSTLGGELPKVSFESIRNTLDQPTIDKIFDRVRTNPYLTEGEQATAYHGLSKLFGAEGGQLPTDSEIRILNDVFGNDFTKAILDKRDSLSKMKDLLTNVLSSSKSFMASIDMSAPFRQGVLFTTKPTKAFNAFKEMVPAFFSQKSFDKTMANIISDPDYKLMRENNLAITKMDDILGSREEAFMSKLTDKIPGIKGSNRAYVAYLNKLRSDVFKDFVRLGKRTGEIENPRYLEAAADWVNNATGRGHLPMGLERSAVALNATLFSPRLIASRINTLNPMYYVKLPGSVRKEAIKTMVEFAGLALAVTQLSKLAGADVTYDPRSADFGKIKVGNTRYSVLGGYEQYIRQFAQQLTGETISSTTGQMKKLGVGYKPRTRYDLALSFFESKESPYLSLATSLLKGTNAVGEKTDPKSELAKRFTPMFIQDLVDLYKDKGIGGIAMGAPAFFGVGTQTYGPKSIGEEINKKNPYGILSNLENMKPEERKEILSYLKNKNSRLYNEVKDLAINKEIGLRPEEEQLKDYTIGSGERAKEVDRYLNKIKDTNERREAFGRLTKSGILTKDVLKQMVEL